MKQLNFFERAIIKALVVKFESGIIACSLVKTVNEIGGITHETIRNHFYFLVVCCRRILAVSEILSIFAVIIQKFTQL